MLPSWRPHWPLALALAAGLVGLVPPARAARTAGRGTVTAAQMARIGQRRVTIGGQRVREEAPLDRGGHHIVPNELARRFATVLRGRARTGSVLAVGSFRGLHDAAFALEGLSETPRGFHTVLIDADAGTTQFNEAHIALVGATPARAGYLAHLRGGVPDQGPGRLLAPTPALPHVRRKLAEVVDAYAAEPGEAARAIFGSDVLYGRVHDLARTGRVRAVAGNLLGPRTLKDLGRALRRRGETFSVLDVSNVPAWITGGRGGSLPALVDALHDLPLAEDAVVLLTDLPESSPSNRLAIGWDYYAISARDLATARRKGYVRGDPGKGGWGSPERLGWQDFLAEAVKASPPHEGEGAYAPPTGFADRLPAWQVRSVKP